MRIFEKLRLWQDPIPRPGPEAMAVDEWLLETADCPVLRVYRWAGDWASLGYFGKIAGARAAIPGVAWVRRWTGGGLVDHRSDWTYTLAVPAAELFAAMRGSATYRLVHEALAVALLQEEIRADLAPDNPGGGSALCFECPVGHDLLGPGGGTIAGAGQRRTRAGLLHQGSVAIPQFAGRAAALAGLLARSIESATFAPPAADLAARVAKRYGNAVWTVRR